MCLQYQTDFTTLTDMSCGPSSFSQTLGLTYTVGPYRMRPLIHILEPWKQIGGDCSGLNKNRLHDRTMTAQ